MRIAFIVMAFLGFITSAQAHLIVAKEMGKNKYEIAFWTHAGFEKYKSSQLLSVNAYDSDLKSVRAGVNYQKDVSVLTDKTPAIITATFDAGYWVDTHQGFVSGEKTSAQGIVFGAIHSIKLTKTIFSWKDTMINPVGQAYEVVPLINPLKLKVGDILPVMVLKDGKPAQNVSMEVANHDELQAKTNAQGVVLIPIKNKGLQLIAATFEEQIFDDPKASILFIQSALTFELK